MINQDGISTLPCTSFVKVCSFIGRQHLANHFIMEGLSSDTASVKAYFTLVQHNYGYRRSFVMGCGNWNNIVKRENERWLFKELNVSMWMEGVAGKPGLGVPWVGDVSRALGKPNRKV